MTAAPQALRRARLLPGGFGPGRGLRALAAAGLAGGIVAWSILAGGVAGRLLALPAAAGLLLVVAGLAAARRRRLGSGVAVLAAVAGAVVAAAGTPAHTAAAVGVGLVGVLELGRWSIDRRVEPEAAPGTDRRRWLHLVVTSGTGWVVGVATVAGAAGLLALPGWRAVVAAVGAVAVAAVTAVAARLR